MTKPPEDLQERGPASRALLARAQRLRDRAARAPIGSNQRRKCLSVADDLTRIAQGLVDEDMMPADWSPGWRDIVISLNEEMRRRDKVAS
jgi:hypothetical protein